MPSLSSILQPLSEAPSKFTLGICTHWIIAPCRVKVKMCRQKNHDQQEVLTGPITLYFTYIKIGVVHVSSLKHTVGKITVGEIAKTEVGTFEVDVPEVKV